MSIQVTLPSKKVVDVRPFMVDLEQWLETGETISSVEVTVTMYTGTDPDPSDLLFLPAEVDGTVVHQRLKAGIPGNIYIVTMDVLTTDARHFLIDAYQAVLPNGVPAEDLYLPFYYTSRPYPLETLEGVTPGITFPTGFLVTPDLGELVVAIAIQNAELYDNLESYVNGLPEGINCALSLQSGTLVVVLITYSNWPWEGVNVGLALQAGSLVNQLVTYPNWPAEGVEVGLTIQSGSIT